MWGAVLGLAGSIYGANKAAKGQAAALAQQQYENARQREIQMANLGMARQAQQQQFEENEYQRQIERLNRRIVGQERLYQQQEFGEYRDQLMEERRAVIERQLQEDKAAARDRQFRLEQLLQNQDLAQDERAFAIQQLEQAKSIAAGERDEEKRRLLEDRAKAEIERDFLIEEYRQAQDQFQQERGEQMAFRDMLMSRIDAVRDSTSQFAESLGVLPEVREFSQDDFDEYYDRRVGEYQDDIDRAATKVLSQSEASLNRRGMLNSTLANDARGDVAKKLAQQYSSARDKAYDDTLRYITGEQTLSRNTLADEMTRRKYLMDENLGIEGYGINQMMNMPGMVGSATGGYNLMGSIPSSIYDRNISSANNYTAPVNIGTGIYDNINIGTGLGGFLNQPSAASTGFFNINSRVFNPYGVSVDNPQSYLSNAASIGNQLSANSQANYANATDLASEAGKGLGTSVANFADEYGSWWKQANYDAEGNRNSTTKWNPFG